MIVKGYISGSQKCIYLNEPKVQMLPNVYVSRKSNFLSNIFFWEKTVKIGFLHKKVSKRANFIPMIEIERSKLFYLFYFTLHFGFVYKWRHGLWWGRFCYDNRLHSNLSKRPRQPFLMSKFEFILLKWPLKNDHPPTKATILGSQWRSWLN